MRMRPFRSTRAAALSMRLKRALVVGLCVVPLLVTATASAQSDANSEATLEFNRGVAALRARRFDEALDHLLASNRLVRQVATAFNIGIVFEERGELREAFNWYAGALQDVADETVRSRIAARVAGITPRLAVVEVETDPPSVDLYLDNVSRGTIGRSPRRYAVEPGRRRFIARRDDYHDADGEVVATVGATVALRLTLERTTGSVTVISTPAGAQVRRQDDNTVLGTTPLTIRLPTGRVPVVVSAGGYIDQTRELQIREEAPSTTSVTLARSAASTAVLSVRGAPDGAEVVVDGRVLGALPLTRDDLSPGSVGLVVRRRGLVPWSARALLEAGAATRIDVTLRPPPVRAWDSLRWVGIGLVGAGAAATATLGGLALAARGDFQSNPGRAPLERTQQFNIATDVALIATVVTAATTVLLEFLWPRPRSSTGRVTTER